MSQYHRVAVKPDSKLLSSDFELESNRKNVTTTMLRIKRYYPYIICAAVFLLGVFAFTALFRYPDRSNTIKLPLPQAQQDKICEFSKDISRIVTSVLCAAHNRRFTIGQDYQYRHEANDCLIAKDNSVCQTKKTVPKANQIKAVTYTSVGARNIKYNQLAQKAESLVPRTYWREGYRNEQLLLCKKDGTDLIQTLVDHRKNPHLKPLELVFNCVSDEEHMEASFRFDSESESKGESKSKRSGEKQSRGEGCGGQKVAVIESFWKTWTADSMYGGSIGNDRVWRPRGKDGKQVREGAEKVLGYFFGEYGAKKSACGRLLASHDCRAVLAAAILVATMHNLSNLADARKVQPGKVKRESLENDILVGYLLSSLGRALLHADTSSTGNGPVSAYKLKLVDFIGLQSAYLQLYIETSGAVYTKQLDQHVPLAFVPEYDVTTKPDWKHLSFSLEPVTITLRNWMYTVEGNLRDYGPYRPLVALPGVPATIRESRKRRVLVDIGSESFFASPKYLLDSYAAHLPFTHLVVIEPDSSFQSSIPEVYRKRYNISHLDVFAEVGTGTDSDLVKLLPKIVSKDDFVVLKFDIDPNRQEQGATLEWGFLFSLMRTPETAALIDELYISLHFHFPSIGWYHFHTMWEALDCIRYLRAHGMIVHAWP